MGNSPYLEVGSVWCTLRDFDRELELQISSALAIVEPSAFFSPLYKSRRWDGRVRFFNRTSHRCLAGLATLVSELFNLPIRDVRQRPQHGTVVKPALPGVTLRDYQITIAEMGVKATRGIFSAATGSGKSNLAASLLDTLNVPTLIIVPTRDLLKQTSDDLTLATGLPVGICGSGQWSPETWTVATVQTLRSPKRAAATTELLRSIECLIIDEAHLGSADSYVQCLANCPAFFRFGMSGTPLKGDAVDDLRLIGLTGPVICELPAVELVDAGYLARPVIRWVDLGLDKLVHPDTGSVKDVDYNLALQLGLVHCRERNERIVTEALRADGERTLVLVQLLPHGSNLQQIFAEHGVDVPFISGEDDGRYRDEMLDDFREGRIRRLIASRIFDAGINIPWLDTLVMAHGGASPVATIQRIGRTLRKPEGKEGVIIVDFLDRHSKHLAKQARERQKLYQVHEYQTLNWPGRELL